MSPTLRYAILISLVLHVVLAAYFYSSRRSGQSPTKKGMISVDFIQSVAHPEQEVSDSSSPKSSVKSQAPAPIQQATIGDANAVARESALYITEVTRLIHQRKIYPRSAIDREEEGRVVIGVSLSREGQVIASKIEEPSPFASLNQAALDTISAVGKFPALPGDVPEPFHLHIPLVFKIEP